MPEPAFIAGVDEVGRGPLAGPVVTAAVILDPNYPIDGLKDSKALSEKRREALDIEIRSHCIAFALGRAEVEEIDEINILQATMVAMQRAVQGLSICPEKVLVDGNRTPGFACPSEAIVGGDGSVAVISAASIIAKVARDREMVELDRVYSQYGFAQHKGYPTRMHMDALMTHGVTPIHRRSFAPVRRAIEAAAL